MYPRANIALNNAGAKYDSFPVSALNHAGDVMTVYRALATQHGLADASIGCQTSTDLGATWGAESIIQAHATGHDLREPLLLKLATADYMLLVWLDVLSTGHSSSNAVKVSLSTNDGSTWGTPVSIDWSGQGDASVGATGPPIQLPNGDILIVLYTAHTVDYTNPEVHLYKSTDDGATWSHVGLVRSSDTDSKNWAEPHLVPSDSNTAYTVLLRENGALETFYTQTTNSGSTWSTPVLCFESSGPGRNIIHDGDLYVLGRSDDTNYAYNWLFRLPDADFGNSWLGPWQFRAVAPSGSFFAQVLNYGSFVSTGGVLYGCWSEAVTTTRSDMYWAELIVERSRWHTTRSGVNADDFFEVTDGTFQNGMTTTVNTESKGVRAWEFQTSDYISLTADPDMDFDGDFTLGMWVKPTGTGLQTFFETRESGSPFQGVVFFYNAGAFQLQLNDASNSRTFNLGGTLTADTWQHLQVAVDWNAMTANMYVDASATTASPVSLVVSPAIAAPVTGSANWLIGVNFLIGAGYLGLMDLVRLDSEALSAAEITERDALERWALSAGFPFRRYYQSGSL